MPACGGATGSVGPGNISVTVVPPTTSVSLGATQQFQATVVGASNTNVSWNVNGIAGGSATVGTISPSGLYAAPMTLPSPASVTVTAVSAADSSASGSAAVTLEDNISVSVSPNPVDVATGGGQVFTANVSGTGAFAAGVTWSVNGVAGGNSTVGTVAPSPGNTALYTAPSSVPSPATVNVTATSVADTSKSGSASVTITCSATNTIAPPSTTVLLTQTQSFQASLCIAPGTPITWDVNGIVGGNATLGTISSTNATAALYTAPETIPASDPVTIHATAGATVASASVTLASSIAVNVAPSSATVTVSQRQSFAANVAGNADTTVTWLVNGVANGSTAIGQICVSGSNPCSPPAGPVSGSIDYLAPAALPQMNPVTLAAVSQADPSKSGSAIVQIAAASGPVAVTVAPLYAFVANSGATPATAQFFVTVSNTSNAAVTWSVQSAVTGQGCAGAACGSVDANGVFTAPPVAPSPNAILITATSEADPTKSGSATIAITSGSTIEIVLPSSVMAGAVEAFPLAVEGVNFVTGSAGAGSTILLNGAARPTTCLTADSCAITINPEDVQSAATLTLQVQNPGAPGALSNPVPFVIVPFDVSQGLIALSSSQSAVAGADIVVTEPTTAAESAPINVDSIGPLTANNCTIAVSPVTVTRPASGSATVSLCIHGNGLDPSFAYAFTGPQADSGGDIGVTASAVTGLFPNTIELDLQISSTTAAGVRTLFITTLNNDRAAATGMLEVK
jgi:hypothetical protein